MISHTKYSILNYKLPSTNQTQETTYKNYSCIPSNELNNNLAIFEEIDSCKNLIIFWYYYRKKIVQYVVLMLLMLFGEEKLMSART